MIALDRGDGPARPQHSAQFTQRARRVSQVLQHEAYEEMIERVVVERQVHQVRLLEGYVAQSRLAHPLGRLFERGLGDVDGSETCAGAASGEDDGLGPDPAAGFQHVSILRIFGTRMEQLLQARATGRTAAPSPAANSRARTRP